MNRLNPVNGNRNNPQRDVKQKSNHNIANQNRSTISKKVTVIGDSIVTEPVAQLCSVKNVFLEILQNLQKNTCARVSKKETLVQVISC